MTVSARIGLVRRSRRARFVERDLEVRFPLQPGDRPLVEAGAASRAGEPLLERLRDRRVEEVPIPAALRGDDRRRAALSPRGPAG